MNWRIVKVECAGPEPTPLPIDHRPLLLLFPADADGEALAGATAAATGAALGGRILSARIDGARLTLTRSAFGGRAALRLEASDGLVIATTNDFDAAEETIRLGQADERAIDERPLPDRRTALDDAALVVSGGRGLDAEGFAQLQQIADALGGAVGASLPAIDLGLAPVSQQVGQSGKFVTPQIYLAAGISGTPQHLAGIGSATRIIAINSDREAPIFRYAEAGAVGDAATLLPHIARALGARDGEAT